MQAQRLRQQRCTSSSSGRTRQHVPCHEISNRPASLRSSSNSARRRTAVTAPAAPAYASTTSLTAAAAAAAGPAPTPTAAAAASAAAVAYDAVQTADAWSKRPVPVIARLCEIGAAFGGWWLGAQLHRDERKAAADMRKVLVGLGPAFVKIGQALSSRPDVLPPAYLQELELLQDRIPPFSDDEALQVLEAELGLPWQVVFRQLSPSPVAAASLGQVYRGRLASTGAEVAVKVQRPGVVEAIGRDTYILRNLAAVARRQLKLNTDLPALVDEWAASLFKELDYRREAANAIRFAKLFSFMPEVVVPEMYLQYTTPRVLVMEWIEGERLRSASQQAAAAAVISRQPGSSSRSRSSGVQQQQQQRSLTAAEVAEDLRLVEIGVRCSLEQMLEEGFYHADPHPGNLLKTRDGRLAYLDFGMMGEVEAAVRQALIRATLHLVNREYERLAEDFVVLGLLPQGTDMDDVLPALSGVFQTALAGGVSNISFSSLSADLGRTMYRYSFRIPPYYTLLVRSLSVLEGIALASDPNYKVLGAAYPWVSRRLLTQNSPELHATLDNLLYDKDGQFQFDRLESLLEQAAKAAVAARSATAAAAATRAAASSSSSKGSVTPAVAAAAAAAPGAAAALANLPVIGPAVAGVTTGAAGELLTTLIPALSGSSSSSVLQQQQQQRISARGSEAAAAGGPLALVLSPEGKYIRGILEDELAKGLDAAWRLALDSTVQSASQQVHSLSQRLGGVISAFPGGTALLPPWLQQQQQQSGTAAAASGSSSNSSSGALPDLPALLDTLVHLPRLAAAEDRAQVEGLTRLATQLAAFSTANRRQQQQQAPGQTSSSSSSSSSAGRGGKNRTVSISSNTGTITAQQQQQQQDRTSAVVDQMQQTAVVLNWLLSEVQLLSPEARREALSIPLNILSKLASRLAARAVRAVLSPPVGTTALSTPAAAAAAAAAANVPARQGNGFGRLPARLGTASPVPVATSTTLQPSSSSSSSSDSTVNLQAPGQQQLYKQRAGRQKPNMPAQRALTYTPEQQQQQWGTNGSRRGVATPSTPPGGILAATVRNSSSGSSSKDGQRSSSKSWITDNGFTGSAGSTSGTPAGNGIASIVRAEAVPIAAAAAVSANGSSRVRSSKQRQLVYVELPLPQQQQQQVQLPPSTSSSSSGSGVEVAAVVVEADAVVEPVDVVQ